MEEEHCWNAIRYVERNPVRAGIVQRAEDYPWSSAAAHCGLRDDSLLSGECPLVLQVANWSEWLKGEPDAAVVEVIRRHTQGGRPLGSHHFLIRVGEQIGRDLLPKKRGPQKKDRADEEPPTALPLFG